MDSYNKFVYAGIGSDTLFVNESLTLALTWKVGGPLEVELEFFYYSVSGGGYAVTAECLSGYFRLIKGSSKKWKSL